MLPSPENSNHLEGGGFGDPDDNFLTDEQINQRLVAQGESAAAAFEAAYLASKDYKEIDKTNDKNLEVYFDIQTREWFKQSEETGEFEKVNRSELQQKAQELLKNGFYDTSNEGINKDGVKAEKNYNVADKDFLSYQIIKKIENGRAYIAFGGVQKSDHGKKYEYSSLDEVVHTKGEKGLGWEKESVAIATLKLSEIPKDGKGTGKENESIWNELRVQGWSERKEMDPDTLEQIQKIYFADAKGNISLQINKLVKKTSENQLDANLLDFIDDDDDIVRPIFIQKSQITFDLNSIFGSQEKTTAEAEAKASAWDGFWKDLLNSAPKEQSDQEQPKGLLEIFGFKNDLENHTAQTNTVESAKQVEHINLFGVDSPALAVAEAAEPFIKIIENQPALVSEVATASAQTGKFEAKPLLSASDKTQAEAITLYIEESAEAGHAIEQSDATPSINIVEPEIETAFIIEKSQEAEQLALIDVPKLEPVIIQIMETKDETQDRKQDAAIAIADFEPVPSNTVAPIAEIQPHTVIAGSESDDLSDEASVKSEAIFSYRHDSEAVAPTHSAILRVSSSNAEMAAGQSQAQKKEILRPSDAFRAQDDAKEVKIASTYSRTEIRGSADKSAALAMTESLQDESQKSQDIKELPLPAEADEPDRDPILSKDEYPTLGLSPAVIPEFSLPKLSSAENIRPARQPVRRSLLVRRSFSEGGGVGGSSLERRNLVKISSDGGDPEQSIMVAHGTKELNIIKHTKPESKTTNNQLTLLREQVRALRQVIKLPETNVKITAQNKAPAKAPESTRLVTPQRQKFSQRQAEALEKDQTSVILTALKRLQAPKPPVGISSENLSRSKPRVAEFTSRERSIPDYQRTVIRSPKLRLINSSENPRQTKFNQALPVAQSYLDEVELTADNSSGIRLAA